MKRFSIRDFLLLFDIVSLAFEWWADRRNRAPTPSRYQIQVVEGHAFVIDTATGQVWEKAFTQQGGFSSSDFLGPKAAKNR